MKRLLALGALLALALAGGASAQTYPSKPVKLVVPFTPGGVTDNIGRVFGERMGRELGQQFIIDNRVGANGRIGTDAIAKSSPDGYLLLLGGIGAFTIHPHLMKMPYDPVGDFIPVSLIATNDTIAATGPVRSQTLPDLPTLDESGLKGFNSDTWIGLFAPARTPDRVANGKALDAIIEPVMAVRTIQQCLDGFEKTGIPAGPINNLERIFADPHVRERGAVVHFEHPEIGAVACLASPMRLSATQVRYDRRPPMLGEHTRQTLRDLLGLSDEAMDALRATGAIG